MAKGALIVVSGPSGAGKGTLCKELLDSDPNVRFSVSATTRAPRPGEEHGKHYFFISQQEFQAMVDQNEFLEYACVFGKNWYGTPKAAVDKLRDNGVDVILDIDVQGAMNVKKIAADAVFVFIAPPSFELLHQRLIGRGTETEEQIAVRLNTARDEINFAGEYDYIIINDDLTKAVDELKSIVTSLRCKMDNKLNDLMKNWRS